MAVSIPGGAFKNAAGEWHDADGKPLSKDVQAQAEKLYAEQANQRAAAERALVEAEARRNPLTQALLLQQARAK